MTTETADARVAELTEQLVTPTEALIPSRREETLRVAYADLRRTYEEMPSSAAFRLIERIRVFRNVVRRALRR